MQDLALEIPAGGRAICQAAHWHGQNRLFQEAKIYHPVRGRGWVAIEGEATHLRPGRLYLIPPYVKLSFATPSEIVIEFVHFRFQSPWLDSRLASRSRVHPFSPEVSARWAPVCGSIDRWMREHSTHDTLRIHAMLLELAGLTLRTLPPETPLARAARERMMPALQLLDSQATRHPSLQDAARLVHLSPEHFHRLFQKIFRTTPYQFAHARRMNLAKNLLMEGGLSVAEVAESCGYPDPFYFSRVFRRYFGASPGRVRRGLALLAPKP